MASPGFVRQGGTDGYRQTRWRPRRTGGIVVASGLSPAEVSAGRRPVICGLGMTEMGKVYGRTSAQFAADAVRRAAADAGLPLGDLDGLLLSCGLTGGVGLDLQLDLGLHDLGLLSEMQAYGSTAGAMVPPVRLSAVLPGTAVSVPPQLLEMLFGLAMIMPAGSESVKEMPVRVKSMFGGVWLLFGFVIVKLRRVEPVWLIVSGRKSLLIVGGT